MKTYKDLIKKSQNGSDFLFHQNTSETIEKHDQSTQTDLTSNERNVVFKLTIPVCLIFFNLMANSDIHPRSCKPNLAIQAL
ncbi:hypothetical protein BpHYR1_004568 [Brachionus plicatilis]|uniref:Uncharacterized protein n=1 Tax=Brachionus plicatilis TaxID=10195 RepID=A0A3M7PTA4_BRAPC|nr:hypothetical protein BpHYR1_004568 [Brachionus plicatilis]